MNIHSHQVVVSPAMIQQMQDQSSSVEGICVNRKAHVRTLPGSHVNIQQDHLGRVELFRLELEQGRFHGTRDFFAHLRFDNEIRSVCMDRLARGYRKGAANAANDSVTLKTLQAWTLAEPDNKDAHLLYGLLLITSAWGALRQSTQGTEEERFAQFDKLANKAENALDKAIEIDPTDPLPYANKITASRELQMIKTTFQQFQQNCRDKHNQMVHEAMLYRLTPHWGGSNQEMLKFARNATIKAQSPPPAGHPLWSLLAKAHMLAWQEHKTATMADDSSRSSNAATSYWKDRTVGKEIVKAYRKFRAKTLRNAPAMMDDTACSNLFAFCLYKCKAYKDALPEFQKIGPMATVEEPWRKESHSHWKKVYERARGKVMARAVKDGRIKAEAAGVPVEANNMNPSSELFLYDLSSSSHHQQHHC
ncbi:expressed unknown protein [Seminavis robusta]|uniref:Uncharacterized protein n=1 Tax=Seminavis robusta TaxID=568900 RepID=A0A9N8H1Y8_9STRA|nr:expressed unknown protein [Seminavis robusta]|eukprot:Sro1_g000970.1 n/a (420) ;mRNA; r:297464-298723